MTIGKTPRRVASQRVPQRNNDGMVALALILLVLVAVLVVAIVVSNPEIYDLSIFGAVIPVNSAGIFITGAVAMAVTVLALLLLRSGIRRARLRRKQLKALEASSDNVASVNAASENATSRPARQKRRRAKRVPQRPLRRTEMPRQPRNPRPQALRHRPRQPTWTLDGRSLRWIWTANPPRRRRPSGGRCSRKRTSRPATILKGEFCSAWWLLAEDQQPPRSLRMKAPLTTRGTFSAFALIYCTGFICYWPFCTGLIALGRHEPWQRPREAGEESGYAQAPRPERSQRSRSRRRPRRSGPAERRSAGQCVPA